MFYEAVFEASSVVPIIVNFFTNDKNSYPLTYFVVLGFIEYPRIAKLGELVISINKQC